MFNREGEFKVKIIEAMIAEPKFATDPAFDVAIRVECTEGECAGMSDWWRGEVSSNYGKGTMSQRMACEITLENLKKLGWKNEYDFTNIHTLVGVETTAVVEAAASKKSDGKIFYNVKYLGDSSSKPVAVADPRARMAKLFGGAQVQTSAPPPPVNPFGGVQQATVQTQPGVFMTAPHGLGQQVPTPHAIPPGAPTNPFAAFQQQQAR
jgi:hypothetical protein